DARARSPPTIASASGLRELCPPWRATAWLEHTRVAPRTCPSCVSRATTFRRAESPRAGTPRTRQEVDGPRAVAARGARRKFRPAGLNLWARVGVGSIAEILFSRI